MWQRFSERARKVVFYAQEEARAHGHGNVGAEHMLLGVLRENDSTACRALVESGFRLETILAEVEARTVDGDASVRSDMTLTRQATKVIDCAYKCARDLKNNYIGTEHLLLGLIREGNGIPGMVFERLGIAYSGTEQAVIALQSEASGGSDSAAAQANSSGMSTRAQAIIGHAREAAHSIGEGHISTEHLLLGSIADPSSSASAILGHLGVTPEALRAEIDRRTAVYRGNTWSAQSSPRVQRVLDLAKSEAQADNATLIGTSHFLLAMIREGNGVAGKALAKLGVTEESVRDAREALRKQAQAET
jgi:ATP-dependent Clp protease ATP-binding subunit ClpA